MWLTHMRRCIMIVDFGGVSQDKLSWVNVGDERCNGGGTLPNTISSVIESFIG